jgi:hypothetical protein
VQKAPELVFLVRFDRLAGVLALRLAGHQAVCAVRSEEAASNAIGQDSCREFTSNGVPLSALEEREKRTLAPVELTRVGHFVNSMAYRGI